MTIHWKAVEQYFTVVLFAFQFLEKSTLNVILGSLSIFYLTRPGVKGLKHRVIELKCTV